MAPDAQSSGSSPHLSSGLTSNYSRKHQCVLCGGDHTSRLCVKYLDITSRKKAFFEQNGLRPCECCFSAIHEGLCDERAMCSLRKCTGNDPHAIILCPMNIESSKRFAAGEQVGTICSQTGLS